MISNAGCVTCTRRIAQFIDSLTDMCYKRMPFLRLSRSTFFCLFILVGFQLDLVTSQVCLILVWDLLTSWSFSNRCSDSLCPTLRCCLRSWRIHLCRAWCPTLTWWGRWSWPIHRCSSWWSATPRFHTCLITLSSWDRCVIDHALHHGKVSFHLNWVVFLLNFFRQWS